MQTSRPFAIGLMLFLALLGGPAQAEEFITWIDANGEVRRTLVEGQVKESREDRRPRAEEPKPGRQGAGRPSTGEADAAGPDSPQGLPGTDAPNTNSAPPSEGKKSREGAISRNTGDFLAPSINNWHAPLNIDNFPDGDEVLQRKPGQGDKQPFYVWHNGEGYLRSRFYQPEGRKVSRFNFPQDIQFSPARVLRRSEPADLPEGADPEVASILNLEPVPKPLEAFSRVCCQELPAPHAVQLEEAQAQGIYIDEGTPEYLFSTGWSRYYLIELNNFAQPLAIQLRSFVRGSLFLPTVVFLDASGRPLRMVTDIVFTYEPETWHRYGYLQATLEVRPDQGERQMLLLSTRENQGQSTRLGEKYGTVPHSDTGAMEVVVKAPFINVQ